MNPDFSDLLSAFNAEGVEYLVVGAHALAFHGRVRATEDLDLWVRPEPENARRVLAALTRFGAPLLDLTSADLTRAGVVFQIGLAPIRVDLLTSIDAVEFPEAWRARLATRAGDIPIAILSREHLMKNKRAAGRLQDLADVEWLEAHPPGA